MARTKLQLYFLTLGVAFIAAFVGLVYRANSMREEKHHGKHQNRGYISSAFWAVVTAVPYIVTSFLAVVCLHISQVRSSKYQTVTSILLMYTLNQVMKFSAVFMRRKFNPSFQNPRFTQENLLKARMERDADTLYGKRFKFRNIKNLDDLRMHHPLTTYDHYAKYVEKMAKGEESILVCEELVRFGITSGTTGKGKLIPLTKSRESILMSSYVVWSSIGAHKFGWSSPLQKDLILYVNPRPTRTAAGYIVGPMHLFTEDMKVIIKHMYSTPWEALSIATEFEATYLTLLFGLLDQNIGRWMGPFCSMVHKAMSILETNWERFVHDISTGTIDKDLAIPANIREACEKQLSPEPERSQELRKEFEKGFDGIVRRVWPYMKYIVGINTADFTEKLENGYARGVPIFSPAFASTEGDYGINLWPGEKSRYALVPHSIICEFIPEDKIGEDQPATLLIDEVQKGENYELVVSTTSGFYRYRFGDVIKVVDFHHKTPVVDFMYRSGQLLNLRAEKVTEISVDEAVHHVVNNLPKARIVNWTSAESTLLSKITNDAGEFDRFKGSQFYLIFLELEGNTDSLIVDDKQQQEFDDGLKERNNYYKGYRNAGTISPPRLYLVKPDTFKALQHYIVANTTATYNQFKVPRKLKTAGTLELMLGARIV